MSLVRTPAAAPRWPTLLALVAGVLGVHFALLLGELPGFSTSARPTATMPAPAAALQARSNGMGIPDPAPSVAVARVSTVRWIVPAEASVPQAVQAALTAAARAASKPRPVPPTPSPAPVVEQVQAGAVAPAAVAMAPPEVTEAPPAEPAPVEQFALAEPGAGDTARTPAPSEDDEANTAPDEERLAAAALRKPAPASAAARPLPPAQPPGSTQLDYDVTGRIKGIAYSAQGRLEWRTGDGRYDARMEMKVFLLGSRVQTSTGRVGPAGLMPERFADRSRSEKAAHFDAANQRIRFSNNAPDAELRPGAQDRLSLFLQIASLLQARPQAYASGQTIEMQVAGTGDADIWRFEVGDEVRLSLPAGEVRARLLKRLPRKEFDSTVEMWLAPDLQHLPVRLRVTQSNGDVADQQLSRLP